jgi:hypothetical protein
VRTRNLFMKCDRLACADGLAVASLSPALWRFASGSQTIAGMVVKYRHPAAP